MADSNTVLAIDTALNGCGAGLYERDSGKKTTLSRPMTTGQSEALMPLLQEIVGDFKKIDAVIVTIGPGAFTGMRIGISAAKNLALALDIPVLGITTLQALALGYQEKTKDNFAVIIDSKREDFYFQGFDAEGNGISEPALLSRSEVEVILQGDHYQTCIGDGAHHFEKFVAGVELPDCGLIAQTWVNGKTSFFTPDVSPVYLRGADTSISKKQPRILQS